MNLSACSLLPTTPENSTWFRAIQPAHLPTGLRSSRARGRFNPGPLLPISSQFEALYLAEDPVTALFEVQAMLGSPHRPGGSLANPRLTYVQLNVRVLLQAVVDLTDVPTAQIPLQTTAQELTGDWEGYQLRSAFTPVPAPVGIAPTQELGHALFATGIEGFRAISARNATARTLIVFPANMRPGSSITFVDPAGTIVLRI